jgi:hypothetical protein
MTLALHGGQLDSLLSLIFAGPLAIPASPLQQLYSEDISAFRTNFWNFPGLVQCRLSPLNTLIKWLRPDLSFLELALSDYFADRISMFAILTSLTMTQHR